MPSEDRQHRHDQAAEIARLFVQLADERPAVLDALQALLRAIATPSRVTPPNATNEADTPARGDRLHEAPP